MSLLVGGVSLPHFVEPWIVDAPLPLAPIVELCQELNGMSFVVL